jgi:hypothetical protein
MIKIVLLFIMFSLVSINVAALTINGDTVWDNCYLDSGLEDSIPGIYENLGTHPDPYFPAVNLSTRLYIAHPAISVTEGGSLANSYQSSFTRHNYQDGWDSGVISYTGGAIAAGSPVYLLVNDGTGSGYPAWYLYRLAGWNGMENIVLNGFWSESAGKISNVSLYGTSAPVPEPTTILLLGSGFVGLTGLRRKFKK